MLVYAAIMLIALIGFCGLAVDVGRMELRTLQLQSAADAGAVSGAAELNNGNANWAAAASTEVAAVDTLNGISGVTTTVQLTASSGAYTTDLSAVQVSVTQSMRTLFLGLLSSGDTYMTVSVVAVASPPPCMYFLGSPSIASTSYTAKLSSATVTSPCVVYASGAISLDSSSKLSSPATKISGASSLSSIIGTVTGSTLYNTPVQSDPLAYVTAPTPSGCTYILPVIIILPTILHPGTYCGGLSVTATTVTMLPGLYTFTGGVYVNLATVNGTGVTMYLTKGGIYGDGQFQLNYSGMYVSAPTDSIGGGIPGVVLFADRSWTGGNEDFIFNNSTVQGDGLIYTTGTGLNVQQTTMKGNNYFNIVTANMNVFASTITPSNNYYAVSGGNPLHNYISLVQ